MPMMIKWWYNLDLSWLKLGFEKISQSRNLEGHIHKNNFQNNWKFRHVI